MGLLTAAFIVWLVKSARSRFVKYNSGLQDRVLGTDEDVSNMESIKGHVQKQNRAFETKWADGLRGIASIGVVSSHICLSFWQQLISPTVDGPNGPSLLFQRPVFRLVVQGQSFVALFFILMGFVNSLKPLKQAQNNQIEEALLSLARSSLNRSARLVLPAATVTCLAWLACQMHLNEIARKSDAYWLYHTSRGILPDIGSALRMLKDSLIACWVWGDNPYDQPQWALKSLLVGSFWIFCILLMTITTRPIFRMSVLAAAYFYSWISTDYIIGTNIYFGVFLAQLHTIMSTTTTLSFLKRDTAIMRVLPFTSALLGLYLMSYPSDFAKDAAWSRNLTTLATQIAPPYGDFARLWTSVGAQILCLSIYLSPPLQRLLSSPIPCYLGSVSFSIYLLHGPLMRSILATLVFGPAAFRGEYHIGGDGFLRYPIPSKWTLGLTIPLFVVILLACVHMWATKVEPIFARATKALEDFATGKYSKDGPGSPLQPPVNGGKHIAQA